jgi:hypothetical protein
MPGVVPELFVVEKYLLAGGEYKLRPAVIALQYSVCEFHGRLPWTGNLLKSAIYAEKPAGPDSLSSFSLA